ncbi:unnamed protein product [Gemmataceae bacterium]|nr:unnamed protein product [Gemmataceae bacterium]VTT98982.1 unnamed protein product [Gemmataceae bacterium]
MTDPAVLWAACLADPTDDTARLVLADLLRESDDPDQQARGRFLWAGVTAARWSRDSDVIDDPLYYSAQRELAAVATAGHPAHWLGFLGVGPDPLTRTDWVWDATHDRVTVRIGDTTGTYARGMLAEVAVTLEQWLVMARPALAGWPVERVTVTDAPGLTFGVERIGREWRLEARLKLGGRRVPMSGASVLPFGMSVSPVLADGPAEWWVEERFGDRATLVEGVVAASRVLVADLRQIAGDRWPSPPRKRHTPPR